MRLDHLLSKEHLPLRSTDRSGQSHDRDERSRVVAQGWNVDDWPSGDRHRFSTARKSTERAEPGSRRHARCWVLRDRPGDRADLEGLAPTPQQRLGRGADRTLRTTQWTRASSIEGVRQGRLDHNDLLHWSCPPSQDGRHDSYSCGQVSKSKRWMPWHLEPKKDVAICDKPRGADKRASIPGCPNGETPPGLAIGPGDSRLNI